MKTVEISLHDAKELGYSLENAIDSLIKAQAELRVIKKFLEVSTKLKEEDNGDGDK